MRSVLLCVDGESAEAGKKPISLLLLTLLLQPHQCQQKSLEAACLTRVVISVEQKPRLAGGAVWSRRVLIPFFALRGEQWLPLGIV